MEKYRILFLASQILFPILSIIILIMSLFNFMLLCDDFHFSFVIFMTAQI